MLRSLNISELEILIAELRRWEGAQLQEVVGSHRDIGLGFWVGGERRWLWLDINTQKPMAVILKDKGLPHKKDLKPLHLFMKAHFTGSSLTGVELLKESGRVFSMSFHQEQSLEVRLFPGGQNVIAKVNKKQVSWTKAKELLSAQTEENEEQNIRSLEEVKEQWWNWRQSRKAETKKDPLHQLESQLKKDLKKKRKAYGVLLEQIAEDPAEGWQLSGEWLKGEGALLFPKNVPEDFITFLDLEKSLSENIEVCFQKSKKLRQKKEGQIERARVLKGEIEALQKKIENSGELLKELKRTPQKQKAQETALHRAQVKGRKKNLESGAIAVMGKSAADNLKLLRKARSWDLWLHLKDFPGAHAIVQRDKKQKILDKELAEVASWLASEFLSKKQVSLGDKLSVLVAECRYVRPIKGDKIGRVNYSNEKVLNVTIS